MEKTFSTVEIKIANGIGVLTFNRPDQLNAMNREMMGEIIEGIESINRNLDARVGVIQGKGRAFMAGADIKEYGGQTPEEFRFFHERGRHLYEAIEQAELPWIAAINGFALGGGFEIALACDLIIASELSIMGLPEVFLSLIPGGGGTQRLIDKVGINRVKEMLFTGGKYDSKTLYDWGIVNRIVDSGNFDIEVLEFAEKLARQPFESILQLKRLANLSLTPIPFEQRIMDEGKTVSKLFYGKEAKYAIQEFIKKNKK